MQMKVSTNNNIYYYEIFGKQTKFVHDIILNNEVCHIVIISTYVSDILIQKFIFVWLWYFLIAVNLLNARNFKIPTAIVYLHGTDL